MTEQPDPAIEAARAAYAAGRETLDEIAERLGLSARTIRYWRRKYGWPPRLPARSGLSLRASRRPLETEAKQHIVARLWRAIDSALTRLERAMTTGDPLTPADVERETRAIGALVRNLGKIAELEADVGKRATRGGADAAVASSDDPERLRTALAARLGRLRDGNGPGDLERAGGT